jgi:hypothetical protein
MLMHEEKLKLQTQVFQSMSFLFFVTEVED